MGSVGVEGDVEEKEPRVVEVHAAACAGELPVRTACARAVRRPRHRVSCTTGGRLVVVHRGSGGL